MKGGLPRHPYSNGALESFHIGSPGVSNRSQFSTEGILDGGIPQLPSWKTSMASRFRSLHEGAVMHRNSNLSQRQILALTSDA